MNSSTHYIISTANTTNSTITTCSPAIAEKRAIIRHCLEAMLHADDVRHGNYGSSIARNMVLIFCEMALMSTVQEVRV